MSIERLSGTRPVSRLLLAGMLTIGMSGCGEDATSDNGSAFEEAQKTAEQAQERIDDLTSGTVEATTTTTTIVIDQQTLCLEAFGQYNYTPKCEPIMMADNNGNGVIEWYDGLLNEHLWAQIAKQNNLRWAMDEIREDLLTYNQALYLTDDDDDGIPNVVDMSPNRYNPDKNISE